MSGRKQKPSEAELNKWVKRLCGEKSCGTEVWVKLSPEDFEPFFQAEDVCLGESSVVSAAAASSWVRQAVAIGGSGQNCDAFPAAYWIFRTYPQLGYAV